MIVTITDENGSEFTLASGGRESPADFKVEEHRSIQSVAGLRWTQQKHFDRGNIQTVIQFGITRLHATVEDAEMFILNHGSEVPRSGEVEFRGEGEGAKSLFIDAAKIDSVASGYEGVSTSHSYSIMGGKVIEA